MSATEERDLTQDVQVRGDNVVDRDPELVSAPVGTAEGLDGVAEIAAVVAAQVVTRALQEAESWQMSTEPIVKDKNIRPAEKKEGMEENLKEGHEKEGQDHRSEKEQNDLKEENHEQAQEESTEVIIEAREFPQSRVSVLVLASGSFPSTSRLLQWSRFGLAQGKQCGDQAWSPGAHESGRGTHTLGGWGPGRGSRELGGWVPGRGTPPSTQMTEEPVEGAVCQKAGEPKEAKDQEGKSD